MKIFLSKFSTRFLFSGFHIVETGRGLLPGRGVLHPPSDWETANINRVISSPSDQDIPAVVWSKYRQVTIDPIIVRCRHDDEVGGTEDTYMTSLGAHIRNILCERLGEHFGIMDYAASGILRIRLTLTGTPLITASNGTPTTLRDRANLSRSRVHGCGNASISAISFRAEIYDGTSDRLLHMYESEKKINRIMIAVSFGTMNAVRRFLGKSADVLIAWLNPL
ncbi:DUF3313 family protein [Paraburkholderia tropica]|uniref:DUF3313 family protein n=1 Tax=Paraburkholderia tropica TaxID=92647 RepID=UPI002AB7A575|nr:DUF3313 family protein [Paraburkholderia tropica]